LKGIVVATALLLGGCGSIEGEVRRATDDKPVAGAIVRLSTVGWGQRDGQTVKDAEIVHETTTDANGMFRFAGIDGGIRLGVRSAAGTLDNGALCPAVPMIVRVGGPFAALRADRTLALGPSGPSDDPRAASAERFGVRATGPAVTQGTGVLRLVADGGVAFVGGTGAIPALPADSAFAAAQEVEVGSACGWLFVRTPTGPIAIEARPPSISQDHGGKPYATMMFAPLPTR
jgi:hypothetical protein